MTDNIDSVEDALEALDSSAGQTYITADAAMAILRQFARYVGHDYVSEIDGAGDAAMALSHALADKQQAAREARGFLSVSPHVQVITRADVSEILAEAICDTASDAQRIGNGFESDARFKENMDEIRQALDAAKEA